MVTGEFDEEILRDLVEQGYTGQELLSEFKRLREKVPSALNKMFEDIIANSDGEMYSLEEAFADDGTNECLSSHCQ